jgi:hypothetical protein
VTGALLRRHQLRGRKLREFEVWAAAVDRWSEPLYGASPAVNECLRSAAAELRRLRRYVDPPGDPTTARTRPPEAADVGLLGFLGGFFSGEGSFSLRGRASAIVHLRADDAGLLDRRVRVVAARAGGRWTVRLRCANGPESGVLEGRVRAVGA